MADDTHKRKRGMKPENTGRRIEKDAASKQDMEFGEAMEADMDRYSRDMASGRTADEKGRNNVGYDGNKNLETGQDLTFTDKMYTPVVKSPESAERGDENLKSDNRDIELGEDNTYFWNSNDDRRSIEQLQKKNKDNNEEK
jgi:hypothetical protein